MVFCWHRLDTDYMYKNISTNYHLGHFQKYLCRLWKSQKHSVSGVVFRKLASPLCLSVNPSPQLLSHRGMTGESTCALMVAAVYKFLPWWLGCSFFFFFFFLRRCSAQKSRVGLLVVFFLPFIEEGEGGGGGERKEGREHSAWQYLHLSAVLFFVISGAAFVAECCRGNRRLEVLGGGGEQEVGGEGEFV